MTNNLSPLTGVSFFLTIIALALGNFMTVLDTTITNVSIPTISGNLGVSANEGTWVITMYAVAEAVTMPLTGWLTNRFGQVRVFVVATFAFVIFSLLCGLAWSLEALVIFRVLQGLAGGPLIPLSSTLLVSIFPKDKSHVAVAIWGLTSVSAPVLGPVLGGWICDNSSWSWIFYINIPVGLFLACVVWFFMKKRDNATTKSPIDYIGLILLVVFVTSLQLALDKGRELDWFDSTFIVGCSVTATLSLIVLVIWELTDKNPVLDLSVFKSRNWLVSTITLSFMFGLFFGNIVISPLWLQQQMGYTALWSGLALAPMGISAVIASPIVGKLMPKVDHRLIVTVGMSILGVSFYLRANFTSEVDFFTITVPMFIIGAGASACLVTLIQLGISDLPAQKVTGGTGLQNFLRILSMAIGSSLSQTYWERSQRESRSELVSILNEDFINDGIANMAGEAVLENFSHLVDVQAMMLGTNDFYAWASVLMFIFASFIWLVKKNETF